MKTKSPYLVCFYFYLLFFTINLTAQCDNGVILKAGEDYQSGRFDEVIAELRICAFSDNYNNKNTDLQIEALTILAKTYIALDSLKDAKKAVEKIIVSEPTFSPYGDEPYYFKQLFITIKKEKEAQTVSSASKTGEDITEAPATIMLITEEQIKNRGYMDLEQLLHDLPGFDIARSNGILHSNFYQRGYRNYSNDRFLVLIDGVEENGLTAGVVYLSRQYPLSNIKSVEVIYGPVSTIYGPNSFLGTISITTKSPGELITEGNNLGIAIETGYGSWNTRYIDGTIAMTYPKQDIDISFTYRRFQSDEPDFGKIDRYQGYEALKLDDRIISTDTTPNGYTVRELYTDALSIKNNNSPQDFFNTHGQHIAHFFDTITNNGELNIIPTELGLQAALDMDNAAIASINDKRYQDFTQTDMLSLRVRIKNLYAGIYSWKNEEGNGLWFSSYLFANDQKWSPQRLAAFVKYEQQFTKKFSFVSFARFKYDKLHKDTYSNFFNGYRTGLGLENLIKGIAPSYSKSYYRAYSNQVRLENTLTYRPDKYTIGIVGIENRLSSIQNDYYSGSYPQGEDDPNYNVTHYSTTNLGAYIQLSQNLKKFSSSLKDLKIIAGIRGDQNKFFGRANTNPVPSVRMVGLYTPKNYVFKLIYSSAFKTPILRESHSTSLGARDTINPSLKAEQVENYELSIRRFLDKKRTSSIHLTGFYSNYTKAAETIILPNTLKQVAAVGERQIMGIEGTVDYHYNYQEEHKFYFWGNYSYIAPTSRPSNTVDFQIISDMSPHKFNLGVNYRKRAFNANIRMNFLSKPITGQGTTVNNPFADSTDVFRTTAILHGTVSYHFKGIDIQLVVNNILNTKYYIPSMREADGFYSSARLPQNPRGVHLKLRYQLSANTNKYQRPTFKKKEIGVSGNQLE